MAWDFDTYIGLSDHRGYQTNQVSRLDLQYPSGLQKSENVFAGNGFR